MLGVRSVVRELVSEHVAVGEYGGRGEERIFGVEVVADVNELVPFDEQIRVRVHLVDGPREDLVRA
jgi:hypothetical protein